MILYFKLIFLYSNLKLKRRNRTKIGLPILNIKLWSKMNHSKLLQVNEANWGVKLNIHINILPTTVVLLLLQNANL